MSHHEPIIMLGDNAPAFMKKAADIWHNRKTQKNNDQQNQKHHNDDLKSCAGYIPRDITDPIWNTHLQVYKKAHINASQEGFTNMVITDTFLTETCFMFADKLGITDPDELLEFKNKTVQQFNEFLELFYNQHMDIIDCMHHMTQNNKDFIHHNFESALSLSSKKTT